MVFVMDVPGGEGWHFYIDVMVDKGVGVRLPPIFIPINTCGAHLGGGHMFHHSWVF